MKAINKIILAGIIWVMGWVTIPATHAQDNNLYFNVDWQLNLPVSNDFANRLSGWGAQGEIGYYVTDLFAVGAFVAWHNNHKYFSRQTLDLSATGTITSDQQHSIFQVPFGAALRYAFSREGLIEPYIGAKIGAAYSEVASTMNIVKVYEDKWGFFVGPEVGATFYFSPEKKFGVHLATYYNYATNKSRLLGYTVDGLNNWGVRIGAAF